MKRIFSFFLAGILLLSFSACSSGNILIAYFTMPEDVDDN